RGAVGDRGAVRRRAVLVGQPPHPAAEERDPGCLRRTAQVDAAHRLGGVLHGAGADDAPPLARVGSGIQPQRRPGIVEQVREERADVGTVRVHRTRHDVCGEGKRCGHLHSVWLRRRLYARGVNDIVLWVIEAVQAVDPVLRTVLAGLAIMLETSILIGLVVPGDAVVLVAAIGVDGWVEGIALGVTVVIGALIGESIGFWLGTWAGPYIRASWL